VSVTWQVVPASNASKHPAPTPNKGSCAKRSFDFAINGKSNQPFDRGVMRRANVFDYDPLFLEGVVE